MKKTLINDYDTAYTHLLCLYLLLDPKRAWEITKSRKKPVYDKNTENELCNCIVFNTKNSSLFTASVSSCGSLAAGP
jgi:hypothetical protein